MLYQKDNIVVGALTEREARRCETDGFTVIPNGEIPEGPELRYLYRSVAGWSLSYQHFSCVHYFGWRACKYRYRSVCPLEAVKPAHGCTEPCKRRSCLAWQPKIKVLSWLEARKKDRHKNREKSNG